MTHSHCLFLETHRLDGCDHIPSNWCSMRMAHWMAHSSGKPNNKPSQLFPEVVMQCTPSLHEGISLDLQYMDLPRFTTILHTSVDAFRVIGKAHGCGCRQLEEEGLWLWSTGWWCPREPTRCLRSNPLPAKLDFSVPLCATWLELLNHIMDIMVIY